MTPPTVEETRDLLRVAESHYLDIEKTLAESTTGLATAERVLRRIEIGAALGDAAAALVAAKARHEEAEKAATARRKDRATGELTRVETQLVDAVSDAEEAMDGLVAELDRVLVLSRARYAHRKDAYGTASRSHLGRSVVAGWLLHRVAHLDLADLPKAGHHHRAPLGELLGVAEASNDQQGGEE